MFQIYRYFAGWGNLVFFDPEEHQITDKKVLLASIPKLEAQWKIIHEIKLGYPEYPVPASLTLEMTCDEIPNHTMEFEFDSFLGYPGLNVLVFGMDQLPKLPEWTRIEISHVEEGGQYFLSVTVGVWTKGRQASELNLSNLTDVKIYSGNDYQHQAGLMVLDQQ